MKYTLILGLGGVDSYLKMAQTADETGWDSICVPDSIFFPRFNESDYPYGDTEQTRKALEFTPVLEPFVAMSMMAAVTRRVNFYPGVLKVPVRQPLLLAKSISSLAYASGNRLKLGAGISPWKEDFIHNGVDYAGRGKRLDECIEIIRGALSGEFFEYHGEFYDFSPVKLCPAPSSPVPIIIGGHSTPALKRAARLGDGWVSAPTDFETLKTMLEALDRFREDYGTAHRPFECHCMVSDASSAKDFQMIEDLGGTHLGVMPWNPYDPSISEADKIEAIKRFSDKFM